MSYTKYCELFARYVSILKSQSRICGLQPLHNVHCFTNAYEIIRFTAQFHFIIVTNVVVLVLYHKNTLLNPDEDYIMNIIMKHTSFESWISQITRCFTEQNRFDVTVSKKVQDDVVQNCGKMEISVKHRLRSVVHLNRFVYEHL